MVRSTEIFLNTTRLYALFTDESKSSKQSDSRRVFIEREAGYAIVPLYI